MSGEQKKPRRKALENFGASLGFAVLGVFFLYFRIKKFFGPKLWEPFLIAFLFLMSIFMFAWGIGEIREKRKGIRQLEKDAQAKIQRQQKPVRNLPAFIEMILPSDFKEITNEELTNIVSNLFLQLQERNNKDSLIVILNQLDKIKNFNENCNDEIVDNIIENVLFKGSWNTREPAKIKGSEMLIDLLKKDVLFKVFSRDIKEYEYDAVDEFVRTNAFLWELRKQFEDGKLTIGDRKEVKNQLMKIVKVHGETLFSDQKYFCGIDSLIMPIRYYKVREAFPFFKPFLKMFYSKEWSTTTSDDEFYHVPEFDSNPMTQFGHGFACLLNDFATKEDLDLLELAFEAPSGSVKVLMLEKMKRIGGPRVKKFIEDICEEGVGYYPQNEYVPHVESEAEKIKWELK